MRSRLERWHQFEVVPLAGEFITHAGLLETARLPVVSDPQGMRPVIGAQIEVGGIGFAVGAEIGGRQLELPISLGRNVAGLSWSRTVCVSKRET